MRKEIYKINGMGCQKCANKIQDKLSHLDGVKSASVSLSEKQLVVEYNEGELSKAVIEKTVDDLGYELV